jgi:D-glycero-alpha-D-manno-heptose-7-phosphate kinase
MIFSQIPYRISLFGGGTDFPEWFNKNDGMVISTAINKYATIGIRFLPRFFDEKYRIVYSKIDLVNKISQISHPVVRNGLDFYGEKRGIELCHYGDLPARSGIGSSSSFTVGFIYLLNKIKNKNISKNKLAKEAIKLEREIMGEAGGWQDQIIASYGGFRFINFEKKKFKVRNINIKKKSIKKLSDSLLIFYSGEVRNSYIIQQKFKKKIPQLNHELRLMYDLSQEAKKIILSEKNYDDLGKLLDETWRIKKKLHQSVSNNKIDEIYKLAIKSGAIGGKLIGAGLAGFLIFYCPINKQKKLIKSLNKLIHIPFEFEPEGVTIIKE